MTNTIQEIYGLRAVVPYVNNKAKPIVNPAPGLLYGIELEIENCNPEWVTVGFTATDDGSLRNHGWEFISKPMTYSVAAYCLETFFNKNKPKEVKDDHNMPTNESNYSDRTSIHVHANCQNLTIEQVATVCLIYQVYEKLLFNFIGNDRDKNIFCVPWHETQLSYKIINSLSKGGLDGIRRWQKYTALNLLPLQDKGTIEFRHMHGNSDLEFILSWMRLIGHMFAYAVETPLEAAKKMFIHLNTSSLYNHSLDTVFKADSKLLRTPNFEQVLEEGVLEMKYSLLDLDKKKIEQRITEVQERMRNQIQRDAALPRGRVNPAREAVPRERDLRFNNAVPGGRPQVVIPQDAPDAGNANGVVNNRQWFIRAAAELQAAQNNVVVIDDNALREGENW